MPLTVRVSDRVRNLSTLFDFTPREASAALESFDAVVRKYETELFASEGITGGTYWAPLSEAYAKRKKKRRPGRKILVYDGDLRRSLTNLNNPEHVATYAKQPNGNWILRSGATNQVGRYHLEGSPTLPVRKPMSFTAGQIENMRRVIASRLLPFVKQRFRALAGA